VTALAVPVVTEDTAAWPAVTALISCLCEEMVKAGLGPLCLCGPLPGSDISLDYGTEGMAWVRVASAWPSSSFPSQDPGGRGSCTAPLAIQLEVGAARCAPSPSEDGDLPTMAEQFEATRLQMADMAAMRRAIQCCQVADSHRQMTLGAYTPNGPTGGVLWGTWAVFVEEGWGRRGRL
jgi:hypothetical protein